MESANDKLVRAKIQLLRNEPFYASILLSLNWIERPDIETMATNGKDLYWNALFVDVLPNEQLKGVLVHEVMHITNLHHTRQQNRDLDDWNKACDYAINPITKESGFELPDCALMEEKYKDMTAEEIYNKLSSQSGQNQQPKNQSGNGSGNGKSNQQSNAQKNPNIGGVMQPEVQTQSELQRIESETKQMIVTAANIAKAKGKLPAHIRRMIDEILEPVINWREHLSSFLTEIARNDYTFSKPSKRYLTQGLYLPSLHSVERGKFVLIVDTSGSIDNALLNSIAGEMHSILGELAESLAVYYVDSKIANYQEFEKDDDFILEPKGGGGTDFKPAIEDIQSKGIEFACAVYFTDGYCNSFPDEPNFPVLWAVYDNKRFEPPFGEVIHIR